MIVLENTKKGRFLFSLYHDKVCVVAQKCTCMSQLVRRPGEEKAHRLKNPLSVQIDGCSESMPLPDAAYNVPQVRKACKQGWLIRHFVDTNGNKLEKAPVQDAPTKAAAKPAKTSAAKKDKE